MITKTPPPSYLFIYRDLAEKSIALQFMGNWDFKKAEDFKNLKTTNPGLADTILKEKAGNDIIRLFWGIAGGPLYQGEESKEAKREGNTVYFANNVSIDLSAMTLDIPAANELLKNNLGNLVYVDNGELKENSYSYLGKLSAVLIKRGDRYSLIIADRQLASSLIFRLYYLQGAGLEHFKLATHVNEPGDKDNTDIYLYKVEW
jgi:hypothetical protein